MSEGATITEIKWGDFLPHLPVPEGVAVTLTPSTDGRGLSVLFTGLQLRSDNGRPESATIAYAGTFPLFLPAGRSWRGTSGYIRGSFNGDAAASANLLVCLGGGVGGQTFNADLNTTVDGRDFQMTVFGPDGRARVQRDGGDPAEETMPLRLQLVLSLAVPTKYSSALLTVDSIDLNIWTN